MAVSLSPSAEVIGLAAAALAAELFDLNMLVSRFKSGATKLFSSGNTARLQIL
jgi:hypothetical protein